MRFGDILVQDLIVEDMKAVDRWDAIGELIGKLVQKGRLKPEQLGTVTRAVCRRESCLSTAVGSGMAFPHATSDASKNCVMALGRSRNGIKFESSDGQPVTIVILSIVPSSRVKDYLLAVNNLTQQLRHTQLRGDIEQASSAKEILLVLRDAEAGQETA